MKVWLVGEAATHRAVLEKALERPVEIIDLPREAASTSQHDAHIGPGDVVVSLKYSRKGTTVPNFRLLHVPGAGLDGIDFDSLPPGCGVCNVFEHEVPIAEYVCAAMLEWEIGMSAMRRSFSAAGWSSQYRARVPHGEVSGKTLVLLGYGRIGQAIAKRARAFDMHVIALDPVASMDGYVDELARPDQLSRVLVQADYLAIVCPLNEATRGMLNASQLGLMKSDAVIINVSRAEIADEGALYKALLDRRIGGAVLDVWYQYPKGGDDQVAPSAMPFAQLPNVVCTPHSAAWTRKLPTRRYTIIAENIERLLQGKPLQNVVRQPRADASGNAA